ncbi:MAG TPA: PASTA domain-containing protein [Gaiellaceae bacterium]|nr:PASTA domain-containing protein [Gaiellaceae bacterium]
MSGRIALVFRGRRRIVLTATIALVSALVLGLPAAASAAAPNVSLFILTPTGPTTAEIDGIVNPGGEATRYSVDYDLAGSTWCTSNGTSGSAANTVQGTDSIPTDGADHEVSIDLSGLTPGADYCAKFVATNGSGEGDVGPLPWTQGEASALTTDTYSSTSTEAVVAGYVDAAAQSGATYVAQYDVANSEWCMTNGTSGTPAYTTNAMIFNFSDGSYHYTRAFLTGLTVGTEYCAQLFATNGYGGSGGGLLQWTQGTPSVFDTGNLSDLPAYSTGTTTAVVTGYVLDPIDQPATIAVDYDLASSTWCASGGTSGAPAYQSATYSTSNVGPIASIELTTNLVAGQDYCAEMTATNQYGTGDVYPVAWRQGAPAVAAPVGSAVSPTSASFTAELEPAGQSTSFVVQYDLLSSNWCQTGSGSSTYSTPAALPPGEVDGTFHVVTAELTGLTPNEAYCGDVVATNSAGTDESSAVAWAQPPRPVLTVQSFGEGTITSSPAGIDCGADASTCSASFDEGTRVTLTASAAPGSEFGTFYSGPGGPCNGPTCTVTMNSDETIQARFNHIPLTEVDVALAGSGSGTVTTSPAGIDCGSTCSASFPITTVMTLTATAASGSTFTGWSGVNCTGATATTCSTPLLLIGPSKFTATFAADPAPTTTTTPAPKPKKVPCVVPNVKGKTLAAARGALAKSHCALGKITKAKSSKKLRNHVLWQSAKPHKHLANGSKVALRVGRG